MALGKGFYHSFIHLTIYLFIYLYLYYYYFLLWFPKGLSLHFSSSWALGVRWQQRSGSECIPILLFFFRAFSSLSSFTGQEKLDVGI